jgi:hypothetical protein
MVGDIIVDNCSMDWVIKAFQLKIHELYTVSITDPEVGGGVGVPAVAGVQGRGRDGHALARAPDLAHAVVELHRLVDLGEEGLKLAEAALGLSQVVHGLAGARRLSNVNGWMDSING